MTNALVRLAVLLSACVATATAATHPCDGVPTTTSNRWFEWKHAHGRVYASARDEISAYDAFVTNDRTITTHNADPRHTFDLGHNQFSDLSRRDFARRFRGHGHVAADEITSVGLATTTYRSPPPTRVDWVERGAVTPIKDQAQCGSCWAFSAVAALEGAYKIATGKLVSLSEQQLVSCDATDDGCSGGLMDRAFDWIDRSGGLCAEAAYKYTSGGGDSGTCETTCSPVATLSGHVDVAPGNETALMEAVARRPVSVAIEADRSVFQLYKGGVLSDVSCGDTVDHGVVVVGYGHDEDTGLDYWRIKNSWGTSWGEDGFGRLERGRNICAITTEPSYPTGVGPA